MELIASQRNTFICESEYNLRNICLSNVDPFFQDRKLNIYRDIKTFNYLSQMSSHLHEIIDRIEKDGYQKTASFYHLDLEYFFLYMFGLKYPKFNFFSAMPKITPEETILFNAYYQKYAAPIRELGKFLNKKKLRVNGKPYSKVKFLPVSSSLTNNPKILFFHMNGLNSRGYENHVTSPIYPKKQDFNRISQVLSTLKRGYKICDFYLPTLINQDINKIIAKNRQLEKTKKMLEHLTAFKNPRNFSVERNHVISVDKMTDDKILFFDIEDKKLAPIFYVLAKLDRDYLQRKLFMSDDEFDTFYLYLKNGKFEDYYVCAEKDLNLIKFMETPVIDLSPSSSLYEENLYKIFKEADIHVIRNYELRNIFIQEQLSHTHFPTFYFPDGIRVNSELCYWLDMENNRDSIFNTGAVIMEEGYDKMPKKSSRQILNGTYQEALIC